MNPGARPNLGRIAVHILTGFADAIGSGLTLAVPTVIIGKLALDTSDTTLAAAMDAATSQPPWEWVRPEIWGAAILAATMSIIVAEMVGNLIGHSAAARRQYWRLEKSARPLWRQLAETDDHASRSRILEGQATLERAMADLHTRAFGPDPMDDEGGRDLAESLALSARLLSALAGLERALASGTHTRPLIPAGLEFLAPNFDAILAAGHLTRELRDELCDIVDPVVGPQAAEVIACLPLGPACAAAHP